MYAFPWINPEVIRHRMEDSYGTHEASRFRVSAVKHREARRDQQGPRWRDLGRIIARRIKGREEA